MAAPNTVYAPIREDPGKPSKVTLFCMGNVRIKRHVKVKGAATPYDPGFREYLERRKRRGGLTDGRVINHGF